MLVKTTGGENVYIYTREGCDENYPIVGEIENGPVMRWSLLGDPDTDTPSCGDYLDVRLPYIGKFCVQSKKHDNAFMVCPDMSEESAANLHDIGVPVYVLDSSLHVYGNYVSLRDNTVVEGRDYKLVQWRPETTCPEADDDTDREVS